MFSSLGKGMFANVVKARILQGEPGEIGKEVAIKIIRAVPKVEESIADSHRQATDVRLAVSRC